MNLIEAFEDFLDEEDVFFLCSTKRQKVRSVVHTFFGFKVPLEPTHSRTTIKAIVVRPKVFSSEKIIVGLLWEAVYGRKFKVIHWFVLFKLLIRTLEKDESSEAILAACMILSTNVGATQWQSNMKPLRSLFIQAYGPEEYKVHLDEITRKFPFKLPLKSPKIDELLDFTFGTIEQRKPKDVARIGVGYKDKGSLPVGVKPELPTSSSILEHEDNFVLLHRRVLKKFSMILTRKVK